MVLRLFDLARGSSMLVILLMRWRDRIVEKLITGIFGRGLQDWRGWDCWQGMWVGETSNYDGDILSRFLMFARREFWTRPSSYSNSVHHCSPRNSGCWFWGKRWKRWSFNVQG